MSPVAMEWDISLLSNLCWELHMRSIDQAAKAQKPQTTVTFQNIFYFSLSFKLSVNWKMFEPKIWNEPASFVGHHESYHQAWKGAKTNEFTRVLGFHPRRCAPTNTLTKSTDAAAWLDYTNSD